MDRCGRDMLLRKIQMAATNNCELAHALKVYGEDIINAVGAEVLPTTYTTLVCCRQLTACLNWLVHNRFKNSVKLQLLLQVGSSVVL